MENVINIITNEKNFFVSVNQAQGYFSHIKYSGR